MAKSTHHKKKRFRKIFFEYGLHLWLMVFTINVAVFYVAHFYSLGKTCFTPTQVQSDNRCLYILGGKVYEKGTRNSPHQGHPCGTDVTSVVPPSHSGNPASYLIPNYLGDICTAPQAPTAAPQPKPTNIPLPQPTAPPAQPIIAKPFSQLPPTVAPTATIAPTPTTAEIKSTVAPTVASTIQPTIANPYTQLPPPTSAPPEQLIGPAVSFSFALPAPSEGVAPIHKTKSVTLNVYDASLNVQDLKIAPTYVLSANAIYDSKSSTSTSTMFVVQPTDMGASVSAGSYHIAFRTPQSPLTLVKTNSTDAQGTLFHFATGAVAPETAQVTNLLVGDLNGDDKIDIQDYAIFIDCYGAKSTLPTCLAPEAADLNNNGSVDGVDYILLLNSIRVTQPQKQIVVRPTIIPITTVTPTGSSGGALAKTTLPTPNIQITQKPTPVPATPTKAPQTMVAGDSLITLSKVILYAAFLLLLGVGILGAYKSRMLNAVLHKKAPEATPPAPVQPAPQETVVSTAAPVVSEPAPPEIKQISQVFYVSNATSDPATGQFNVTLTDDSGSGVGYMTQQPPADGYYTVSGNVQEVNGAVSVSILTLTPALKPGTSF